MTNWRILEDELVFILRRSLPDYDSVDELDSGDKAILRYSLGSPYEVLNITALAQELDARGVRAKGATQ